MSAQAPASQRGDDTTTGCIPGQVLRLRLRLLLSASGVPGRISKLFLHLRNYLGFLKKKNASFLINILTSLPGNGMS